MKKPDRREIPPQKQRAIIQYPGIERVCANCEHFDGGGFKADGKPKNRHGDCHNSISGRFQTRAIDGCGYGFYPCTTRYPLKAGGVR